MAQIPRIRFGSSFKPPKKEPEKRSSSHRKTSLAWHGIKEGIHWRSGVGAAQHRGVGRLPLINQSFLSATGVRGDKVPGRDEGPKVRRKRPKRGRARTDDVGVVDEFT